MAWTRRIKLWSTRTKCCFSLALSNGRMIRAPLPLVFALWRKATWRHCHCDGSRRATARTPNVVQTAMPIVAAWVFHRLSTWEHYRNRDSRGDALSVRCCLGNVILFCNVPLMSVQLTTVVQILKNNYFSRKLFDVLIKTPLSTKLEDLNRLFWRFQPKLLTCNP